MSYLIFISFYLLSLLHMYSLFLLTTITLTMYWFMYTILLLSHIPVHACTLTLKHDSELLEDKKIVLLILVCWVPSVLPGTDYILKLCLLKNIQTKPKNSRIWIKLLILHKDLKQPDGWSRICFYYWGWMYLSPLALSSHLTNSGQEKHLPYLQCFSSLQTQPSIWKTVQTNSLWKCL